jgi:hypothetical protein
VTRACRERVAPIVKPRVFAYRTHGQLKAAGEATPRFREQRMETSLAQISWSELNRACKMLGLAFARRKQQEIDSVKVIGGAEGDRTLDLRIANTRIDQQLVVLV